MEKTNKFVKAVIFDMDGVIVDSMPYHFLAWYEALRPLGVRVSCFDVYSKEGERWEKTLRSLLNQASITPTRKVLQEVFLRRQKIFKKYFKRNIFKGVNELLVCLRSKGYSLGLVTGSPKVEVERILSKNTRSFFDCLVCGNEVKHGKPHPEPYLKAAKLLKVKPQECVVVENAPYGIDSAKRAGMICIAVSTSLPKEYLKPADFIVSDLREITGLNILTTCKL
ncbi:MAG: HAD family phosphatase [Candidatus Omnitrophica bacterium]|nr:HAD family phosphatase [Candidatus Omnitrophota bacterium]